MTTTRANPGATCALLLASLFGLAALAAAEPAQDDPASDGSAATSDPPVQQVGPVTVTAARGERGLLEVAGHVTLLDREGIEESGATSIPELLRRQPGLFVTGTTTNPAGVQVESRGFNNGGALGSSLIVQVDGRRVNEADTGNTDWALIPIDDVESIEIVRGPTSAIYGDNAVGGVINIRTLPTEGPLRASSGGRVGRYGTYGGYLRAAGSAGPVTASFSGSGMQTNGYRERSGYDDQHYKGSIEWQIHDRVAIGGQGGYTKNFRSFPGALSETELATLGRRAADPDGVGDESRVENHFLRAWVEAFLADDIRFEVSPSYRERTDDVLISTLASGQFQIDTRKRTLGVDAQLRSDRPLFGLPNRLIGGFEFLQDQVESLTTSIFGTNAVDNRRRLHSGYVQNELHVTERLLWTAGARVDRALYDIRVIDVDAGTTSLSEPDFTVWSPRTSLSYRFLPCLSGYFSYSRGFRLPNFDEDAPFFGPAPSLAPQVSDSLEVGLHGQNERIAASLAFYWMWVDDEILFDPVNFTNSNLDEVRHRGIEAALEVAIFDWLSAYANYTLDDVMILRDEVLELNGRRMPITPMHRGSVGLTTRLPHDFEMNANLNVVGSRVLANDFDRVLPKLGAYAVLDLLFAWRPKLSEHVEGALSFGLRNVTNEKYDDFGARYEPSPTFVSTRFFNPAARRSWQVGFGLTVHL